MPVVPTMHAYAVRLRRLDAGQILPDRQDAFRAERLIRCQEVVGYAFLPALPHLHAASVHRVVTTMVKAFCLGVLIASFSVQPAFATGQAGQSSEAGRSSAHPGAAASATTAPEPIAVQRPNRANFEREPASHGVRHLADWIVDSGDNRRLPFAIVDKTDARVFVFNADGRLRGAAAALLGLAVGDDSVPGIGNRALSGIRPEERTTPAGRFVAALDRNLHGKEILWIDYENAISMHPVVTTKPQERRAQRLGSATPTDNRISYGCINVPAAFFKSIVRPAFTGTAGIVYVLPETRTLEKVFTSYDVEERARLPAASPVP